MTGQERTNRHDAILRHAAELFATRGVAATTVRQIAERVGMLSGSLYHHFASKDLMAEEIVVNYLDDLRAAYRALQTGQHDPVELLRELVRVSFAVANDHPHAVAIYQNETAFLATVPRAKHIQSVAREVQSFWSDVINAGVAGGQLRADVNARLFHRLLRDAVWLSPRVARPTRDYPYESLVQDVLAIFLDGFAVTGKKASSPRGAARPSKATGAR